MARSLSKGRLAAAAVALAIIPATVAGRTSVYHVLPFSWTGEPARLAALMEVTRGSKVAEIGAGAGEMAVELGRMVGPEGAIFATEIQPERRRAVAAAAARAGVPSVRVIEAAPDGTALPDACCDAVYLRNVFHHINDRLGYARDLARTVAPRGRVVIVDLAPGALWHLGADHGIRPEAVVEAFTAAGFTLDQRIDHWGGGMFALVFRRG